MARRRMGFRPSLREEQLGFASALEFMAGAAPAYKQEAAAQEIAKMRERIPAAPKPRAAPRQLEGAVLTAISELLATHPRVLWVARFNSFAASRYDEKTGRQIPVWTHRILRQPEKTRMPDFFGLTIERHTCGKWTRPIAIEAKAPGWTKPRDEREREQAAFLRMIIDCGGVALFATSAGQVAEALR